MELNLHDIHIIATPTGRRRHALGVNLRYEEVGHRVPLFDARANRNSVRECPGKPARQEILHSDVLPRVQGFNIERQTGSPPSSGGKSPDRP